MSATVVHCAMLWQAFWGSTFNESQDITVPFLVDSIFSNRGW